MGEVVQIGQFFNELFEAISSLDGSDKHYPEN
jgi:hypothetical protein